MKDVSITVIGYYNHDNTGDEQYKMTFTKMIKDNILNTRYTLRFLDSDIIKDVEIKETDIVILGGGDILNDYFLDEINMKFKNKSNKIIAVSVGLPYINVLIKTEKLAIVDYIFLRTEQDMDVFSRYFCGERLFYLPDISYYLKSLEKPKIKNEYSDDLKIVKKSGKKVIAFCLNRHIYSESRKTNYKEIVSEFAKTILFLLERKNFVVLLPFNTNDKNTENDIIFHTDIYNLLNKKSQQNVLNITSRLDVSKTFEIFENFDLVIPMRFHACLFSIYQYIPLIPILTTKKVTNVLLDIKWNYSYKLDTDVDDIPLKMESSILISKISDILGYDTLKREKKEQTYEGNIIVKLKKYLTTVCDDFERKMKSPVKELMKIITSKDNDKISSRNVNKNKIEALVAKLCLILNNEKLDLSNIDERVKSRIVEVVSFFLTNCYDSKYNHGLMTKMFENGYNHNKEWEWILCDNEINGLLTKNNKNGVFNMNFVDQNDYSGAHRSGWQHVINGLKQQNNDSSEILLDLSIDKTFHWKENVGKEVGIIPYKKDWMGFLHHTFDTTFSDYNSEVLLQNETFRKSLPNCKGIIVFSKPLKDKLCVELNKIGFDINVTVLCHPTDIVTDNFTWNKFIENNDKKIVNVGGWMRNIFSFYNLFIPTNYNFEFKKGTIRKVALKGRHMENYFPIINQDRKNKEDIQTDLDVSNMIKNCSQNKSQNNWHKHNADYMEKIRKSVEVMEHLNDSEYDKLLSENVVFLNLIDASAVNTVIECIVRNTPLIINRLPAIVEILGEDYPLYYGDIDGNTENDFESNSQVVALLSDTKILRNAHEYLLCMDKTNFSVEKFTADVFNLVTMTTSNPF